MTGRMFLNSVSPSSHSKNTTTMFVVWIGDTCDNGSGGYGEVMEMVWHWGNRRNNWKGHWSHLDPSKFICIVKMHLIILCYTLALISLPLTFSFSFALKSKVPTTMVLSIIFILQGVIYFLTIPWWEKCN